MPTWKKPDLALSTWIHHRFALASPMRARVVLSSLLLGDKTPLKQSYPLVPLSDFAARRSTSIQSTSKTQSFGWRQSRDLRSDVETAQHWSWELQRVVFD